MIVLINGSFASGKTTTAELLVQRLYHSMLYDSEMVGAGLAAIVKPIETFTDFQVVNGVRLRRILRYHAGNRRETWESTIWRKEKPRKSAG